MLVVKGNECPWEFSNPPCALCPDICEEAIKLFESYKLFKEAEGVLGAKVIKLDKAVLTCPKNGLQYEMEVKK